VLAAHRAGLRRVVLPEGNRRDVKQIPEEVRRDLEMVFAARIEEVLEATLTRGVREVRARS
jgi:ATP-dependent Lon protease